MRLAGARVGQAGTGVRQTRTVVGHAGYGVRQTKVEVIHVGASVRQAGRTQQTSVGRDRLRLGWNMLRLR